MPALCLLHVVSLHPGVQMGTNHILLEGNPVMDWHPIQGRVVRGCLHVKTVQVPYQYDIVISYRLYMKG